MHLRRLDIHGFKAFAERQRFEFGPGMTVVVGPNGSGKSNVHDAIRWALGEQAHRQIRARKTEDVIFSGSDQRRQLGSAEVTLTLDNSEAWMPIDFSEVTVTRRAHRSGENEYLINGQRVRLADVHDLFRRAQVGQNSYAMMSQGLVDEVLALRPQDRRELIEEAADVRRHRQQLTLSERRLTETRDNLGRVRMLIREVTPRLRQLERQSQRAERYRGLQSQLHEALCVYYEAELRKANDALAGARARHDQQAQEFAQTRSKLDRLSARVAQLEGTATERRQSLDDLQAHDRRLAEEGLELGQQIALAEQRLELLGQRRDDVQADLDAADTGPEATDSEGDRTAALELRVEEARTALAREREALRSADGAGRAVLRELAEAEAKRARLGAELADAERRIAEDERRRARRETEREAAGERREELLDALRALGVQSLDFSRRGTALDEASQHARDRRAQAEALMEQELRALIEARDAVRAAEARVRAQEERQAILRQLAEQASSGNGGSQSLLSAARDGGEADEEPLAGIVGAISHLIRVPTGLELAIEAALADQLSAIVVEREQDAIAAIEYLRDRGAGTATLLPLESVEHNYPLNLFNERGVLGVAARLVRADQRYRPLIDTLLGRTIVVEDLDTARRMIRRGLGSVVSRDGVLLRPDGAYYGGRTDSATPQFALQGEIEALPERIAEAERTVQAARDRIEQAESAVTQARDGMARARDGVDQVEQLRRSHQQRLTEVQRSQAAISAEMRELRRALEDDAGAATASAPVERRDRFQRQLQGVDAEIASLRDRSEAVVAERDAVAERVTGAAASQAAAEGAQRAEIEQLEERKETRRRARARIEQLRLQADQVRQESEDLDLSLRELRERAANSRSALALAQATVGPAHAALAAVTEEQRELAATRGDLQTRQLAAERATMQAESELREHASRLRTLMEQLADEGLEVAADGTVSPLEAPHRETSDEDADEATEEAVPAPVPVRGGAEVDPVALRERITELRGKIRALGPVNVDAVEDLSEERERHDYLTAQVGDLESAEQELRTAIEDLRLLIRTRFLDTFEKVNVAFGEYFQRFFGGGTAELKLVDPPEDSANEDPGVDITAQPPGKRIASLNVLSGGERALTSVSLLFALLSVNPAPICVLDEVDAALDEANVGRFVETLRELCERSQFIVVTHNRRTVEAADSIYGISMGEDSVSRVLSLKLADIPQAS